MRNRSVDQSPGSSRKAVPPVLSHPEKVLYPDAEITKEDVADYYERIAEAMLPFIQGRPLSLVRCPAGIDASCFFQKHPGPSMPDLPTTPIRERDRTREYGMVQDADDLARLTQANVLEIHAWGAKVERIEYPDQLIFDLDPGPGVKPKALVDSAFLLRDFLEELKLESFVRLSGGKGLHIVCPIVPRQLWDEVKRFTQSVAVSLESADPSQFVSVMTKSKRQGKIFVDYLRNNRGATAIANYSTRARPGATVATPLEWNELRDNFSPEDFTLKTVPTWLAKRKRNPWARYFKIEQTLPEIGG